MMMTMTNIIMMKFIKVVSNTDPDAVILDDDDDDMVLMTLIILPSDQSDNKA